MLSKQFAEVKALNFRKYYLLIGVCLVIALFGDSLVLFFAHLLHVIFEFIASILEHGLQVAFDLSERQAQIALFYIVLFIGSFIAWRILQSMCRKIKIICRQASCRTKLTIDKTKWLKIKIIFTVIGATFLMLS